METKKISYSAVVLDHESHIKLLNSVPIPFGWKSFCHHMTLILGELPVAWKSRIGEMVVLKGRKFGETDKVIAFKVDNFQRLMPGQEHITVAVNTDAGGKPKDSNLITDWSIDCGIELVLTGTIQEISY